MEESPPEPRAFSREDLDRVIRRAVELQFEAGTPPDEPVRLEEAEVLRIGAEVGIEPRHLRRAIGEVRAESLLPRPPGDAGVLARLVGERYVRSDRVVPGSVGSVENGLGEHLEVAEALSRVRDRAGRSLWEPSRGALAGFRRSFKWRGYTYELSRISHLQVALTPMEEGFVLVSLIADLGGTRTGMAAGMAGGLGVVASTAGVAAGLLTGLPGLAVVAAGVGAAPLGAFAGMQATRGLFGRSAERIQLAMEGILDRLERGKPLARKTRPHEWGGRLRGG